MNTLLVELPTGEFFRKQRRDVLPTDLVCFDGPDAFVDIDRLQATLNDEIEAAGGFEAWRQVGAGQQRQAA